jgi:hypothetical protein
MTTSGFYQRTTSILLNEDCCDYTGWVPVTEDLEDMTVHWDCPWCGHHENGEIEHVEDH